MVWPFGKSKDKYATPNQKVRLSTLKAGPRRNRVEGSYNSAADGSYLKRHWANADSLTASQANSRSVRMKIMSRARYEFANNSYCKGMVLTLANDIIGTGPRLQVNTGSAALNTQIEAAWNSWTRSVNFASKLRTMQHGKIYDGESFSTIFTNRKIKNIGNVSLDLKVIEADQITTPDLEYANRPNAIDGIVFDKYGNPHGYHMLKQQANPNTLNGSGSYSRIVADKMIHIFRADRAGQYRGICEYSPALNQFAILRDYTDATLKAAEIAASFAAILKSTGPAVDSANDAPGISEEDGTEQDPEPMDVFDIEHGMTTVAPRGWDITQFKAEHPTTNYEDFKNSVLNEIARCLNMPFNIAAGNSSNYNYASGRLDHQMYFNAISVERNYIEITVLNRIFEMFLEEYRLLNPVFGLNAVTQQWFWPGREHVDPAKEAKAQELRLGNLTTTLANEYARQGMDWEEELTQLKREQDLKEKLGLMTTTEPSDDIEENEDEE